MYEVIYRGPKPKLRVLAVEMYRHQPTIINDDVYAELVVHDQLRNFTVTYSSPDDSEGETSSS